MNLLTIRQLQYIMALAEEGSFSRAAERCHVTQSTLSAGIKEAETLLDQQLFDRSKRNLSPTGFGHALLEDARAIIEKSEAIALRAKQYNTPMSAPIRLGIIPTIAPYLIPYLLPELEAQFPLLQLEIFEDSSQRISEDLERGALDLIILAFPFDTPGATQYALFDEDFHLATPACMAKDISRPLHISQLDPNALLLLTEGHCLTDHAIQACALQRSSLKRSYSASSITTLIHMVAHGRGQTLLPSMIVNSVQIPNAISIHHFADPAPARRIGMAWKQGSVRAQDFKTLGDTIKGLEIFS